MNQNKQTGFVIKTDRINKIKRIIQKGSRQNRENPVSLLSEFPILRIQKILLILSLFCAPLSVAVAQTHTRISDLPADPSPSPTDVVPTVKASGAARKVQIQNLPFVALRTLAQIGSTKEIWINDREIADGGDGIDGVGTASDPRNGGTLSKFDAIMRGVSGGTVHLAKGTFLSTGVAAYENSSNGYYLPAGIKIKGAGEFLTTVKLSYFPPSAGEHTLFGNSSGTDGAGIEISDLTVDGNWGALGAASTKKTSAVELFGNNCKIRRVQAINFYGSIAGGTESFPLVVFPYQISGVYQSCIGGEISDCDVSSFLGDNCTAIALFATNNGTNGEMSGAVCNNRVYNVNGTAYGVQGNGIEFYNNYVNGAVSGFNFDTYHLYNARLNDNQFYNCSVSGFTLSPSLGTANLKNVILDKNIIEVNRLGTSTASGIIVNPGSATTKGPVTLRGNTILRGSSGSYPNQAGITAANTVGLTIEDNQINSGLQNNLFIGVADNTNMLVRVNRTETGGAVAGVTDNDTSGSGGATSCTGATIGTGSKNRAGFVTATTTGTSTIVVTFSDTAPTGWAISGSNNTTANLLRQSAKSTTNATLTGTTVTGDVITYTASPY